MVLRPLLSNGETERAGFLVGCDGGHSTVRKALGLVLEGEAIDDKRLLVADVEVDGLSSRDWNIWPLSKGGAIGLCPLRNTCLFQLTAKAEERETDVESPVHRSDGTSREARRLAIDLQTRRPDT